MSAVALLALLSACSAQPFLAGQNMLPGGERPKPLLMVVSCSHMPSLVFQGSLLVSSQYLLWFALFAADTKYLQMLEDTKLYISC